MSNLSADSVGRLAAQADAMRRLAHDPGAFAAAVAAFEFRDPDAFRWVLVEWVEQLSVMEADARKATEFWQGEAQRLSAMAQNRPHWSRWWSRHLAALRAALSSHWARVPHLAAGLLRRSVGQSKYGF